MTDFKEEVFRVANGTLVLKGTTGVGGDYPAVSFVCLYAEHACLGQGGFPKGKPPKVQEEMFWDVMRQSD